MIVRLALTLLLTPVIAGSQQSDLPALTKGEIARAPIVKIEDLSAHPEQYDKRLIRVNASWVDGYHGSILCPLDDDTKCIGVYFACPEDDACKKMGKKLDKLAPSHRTAPDEWEMRGRLTLVGRFKDTKTPPGNNSPRFFLEVWELVTALPKSPR